MSFSSTTFYAIGAIQQFRVPISGSYLIEAAGAQGGVDGSGIGGRGARVRGIFRLREGELIQIVVGRQGASGTSPHQPAAGGGGGSFVWRGVLSVPLPDFPLLAAGGGGGGEGGEGVVSLHGGAGAAPGGGEGEGGESDLVAFHYSGGGGAGWRSSGDAGSSPTFCGGGSIWRGGAGANYCCNIGGTGGFGGGGGGSFLGRGSGGGGGYSGGGGGSQHGPGGGGGGSLNAGTQQVNVPGAHSGDGCVTIVAAPEQSPVSRPHVSAERDAVAAKRAFGLLEPAAPGLGLDAFDPDFAGFY